MHRSNPLEPLEGMMPQRDTLDFITAFAVGAIVGIGATLLLRPEPATRTERILKDLEPYRKRVRKGTKEARRSFAAGAGATADVAEAIRGAGHTLVQDLREEVSDIVATARDDLARAIDDQIEHGQKVLARATRRNRF